MLTKEQILESIKNMPEEKFENFNMLTERLEMLDRIQTGIEQADKGELVPMEEVINELREC